MKAFVDALARHTNISNRELLEKDVLLHQVLRDIAADATLRKGLLFKGGTCLAKCYLTYHRFSEDLDFTWRAPATWFKIGVQEIRRVSRGPRDQITSKMKEIASTHGFAIRTEGRDGITFGRSGQMLTYRLGYRSEVTGLDGFIRIQVNLLDPILFGAKRVTAGSLLRAPTSSRLRFLAPEWTDAYGAPVKMDGYSPEEILVEKVRAILTRQAAKVRDLVDLFFMDDELNLSVHDYHDEIRSKTRFMIKRHARYRAELQRADARLDFLAGEDPSKVALRPLDAKQFSSFRKGLTEGLSGLRLDLLDEFSSPASRDRR